MIPYPHIDPEIVRVGPFALRWYGLMYVLGFGASYLLVRRQLGSSERPTDGRLLRPDSLDSLYGHLIIGLLIGARLGYVLFYDLLQYLQQPWEVFAVWHGGMSFHGGLIGAVLGGILFCRSTRTDPWDVADLITPTAPIGLGLGRLGNFLNGELYGRISDVPWAMVFPGGGPLPRHPSQLYELALEGVLLFLILWSIKGRLRPRGTLLALFLVLYGLLRSFAELFREPDPQLGFLMGMVTMGQLLSSVMIVAGIVLCIARVRQERRQ